LLHQITTNFLEKAKSKYANDYSLRQRWEKPKEVVEDGVTEVVSYFVIGLLFLVLKHLFTFFRKPNAKDAENCLMPLEKIFPKITRNAMAVS
jgi:hypothetical protein